MNAVADIAVDGTQVGGNVRAPGRRRLVSRKQLLIGGGSTLVLLVALALGVRWYAVARFIQSTDDAFVGGDITVLAPKVPGFIATVAVTDNQAVHAGDLLVRLDDRDFEAALERAQAAVAAQQAHLANLSATQHLQQALIAEARASIGAADAEVVRTRDDQARFARLAQRGAASVQNSQKADSDFAQAQALSSRARAGLDAAQRQSQVIDTERQQTQAQLAQAIADRDLAQLNLRYTELRAPVDGVVANRSAQVGAYAAIGTQLLSVVPAQGLWGRRQLQGESAGRDAARSGGQHPCRCAARRDVRRPRDEPESGNRRAVQRAARRECHRQFHAHRAARAGTHRAARRCLASRTTASRAVRAGGCGPAARRAVMTRITPPDELPTAVKVLAFAVMSVGFFIALLDIQIVSASLRDIGGGLSAGADETAWVQTSYLIAEIIVIPLSGWLSRVMSTRWLFAVSAAGFTLTSLLCGWAWDIHSMIVFRALQGFLGGSMIPTVFTTAFAYFKGHQRIIAAATVGALSSLAPTLGPTVGGWITDHYSWHWLFFVNLVPGAIVTVVVPMLVRIDAPDLKVLRGADYLGMALMALSLGCLEYTLEEGSRWGWLDDATICATAWIAALAGVAFIIRSLMHPRPVVDLRALKSLNFSLGCFFSFVSGVGIFATVYLTPLFLGRVRGFSALQIGYAVFATGLFQIASIPLYTMLARRVDLRWLMMFGLACFGASMWNFTPLTHDWGWRELLLPQGPARFRPAIRGGPGGDVDLRVPRPGAAEVRLRSVQSDAQSRRRHRHCGVRHVAEWPHQPALRATGEPSQQRQSRSRSAVATRRRRRHRTRWGSGARAHHRVEGTVGARAARGADPGLRRCVPRPRDRVRHCDRDGPSDAQGGGACRAASGCALMLNAAAADRTPALRHPHPARARAHRPA